MKFPFFLLALAALSQAQTLPGNFETSLLCDSSSVWVTNYQDQLSRITGAGAAITTATPGLHLSNANADYPLWRGVYLNGHGYFPLANLNSSGKGFLSAFWKASADSSGKTVRRLSKIDLPMPSTWATDADSAWGASDSSKVLWQLKGNDSLEAWGLSATGHLRRLAACGGTCTLPSLTDSFLTVRGIGRDSAANLWIATTKGLWRGLSGAALAPVDTSRAFRGVWPGQHATLVQSDSAILWSDAVTSPLLDLRGDTSVLSGAKVGAVAWLGDTAWVLLQKAGVGLSGIVRVKAGSILSGSGKTPSLFDTEDGLPFSESANLADIARETKTGRLWVASRGEGLAVDSNDRWTLVSHKAALQSNLKEVRIVPTRLESGSSLIAYNLANAGNVDIEVFNGAMEKVRTIVRGAPRNAGGANRSEVATEDRWDGCTDGKRLASIGLYYVRVKSGSQTAWGKVFQLKGGASCD